MNKPNPNATEVPQDEQEQRADCAARYLRGELNPAEVEAFEITLLEDPLLFEEVLLQRQLQAGLEDTQEILSSPVKASRETEVLPMMTYGVSAERQPSWQKRFASISSSVTSWGSLARAAGVAILAVGLVVQSVRLQHVKDELHEYLKPQFNIPTILIDSERSLNKETYDLNNNNTSSTSKFIYMKIDAPALSPEISYDVIIKSPNSTYQSSAKIGDDGYLTVLTPLLQSRNNTHLSIAVLENNELLFIKEVSISR